MLDLQIKTRREGVPVEKQKVYFTCHGADFDRCFPEITEELLKKWDLAILYMAPGDEARLTEDEVQELKECLRDVQLLVAGVTKRLTEAPGGVCGTLFRFAVEENIPVLPLTPTLSPEEDQGLGGAFGQFSRDNIQLLDRNRRETHSVPYEKKLEDFLDSIFIKDGQLAEIRKAFSSRFFLSYRKEDWRGADELLRLVHGHPLCWDTAVWYDKFLQPGKNYQGQIRQRLEKAELFLLAATPRIWRPKADGDENFVVADEYPAAVAQRKPVFPAELETLSQEDREKVKEKLPGLPALVPAEGPEFSAALEAVLAQIPGFRQKEATPERLYLIGLAYLNGIDVEVDRERAVKLLRRAAEAGWLPAADRLAEMYRTGQGAERDLKESLRWRELLAEQRQEDPEGAFRVYVQVLRDIRNMVKGGKLSSQYIYKLMAASVALNQFGRDLIAQDWINGRARALPFYELALDFQRLHYELDPIPPVRDLLIAALEQAAAMKEWKKREESWRKRKEGANPLPVLFVDKETPEELERWSGETAADLCWEALKLAEDLCENGNDKVRREQAKRQKLFGHYCWSENDREAARAFEDCLRSYALWFPYSKEPEDLAVQAEVWRLLGEKRMRCGELKAGLSCFERAYRMWHKRCWPFVSKYLNSYLYLPFTLSGDSEEQRQVRQMEEMGALLEVYSGITAGELREDYYLLRSREKEGRDALRYDRSFRHLRLMANVFDGSAHDCFEMLYGYMNTLKARSANDWSREDWEAYEAFEDFLDKYLNWAEFLKKGEAPYYQWYQAWHKMYLPVLQKLRKTGDFMDHDAGDGEALDSLLGLRKTLDMEYRKAADRFQEEDPDWAIQCERKIVNKYFKRK